MPPRDAAPGRRAELDAVDPRFPLHERVQEALRRRVIGGEFSPSTALPAEQELAADYEVSLGTMRRALAALATDGLLERRQGDGTYLRRARMDSSLFRFFRYGGGSEVRVPQGRIVDREVRDAAVPVAEAFRGVPGDPALYLHRVRSHDGRVFLVEDIWLPLPRFVALVERPLDTFGDLLYPLYESACDTVVAAAGEDLSVGAASAQDARLLGCAAGDPVVVIERRARVHSGEVVELRRSRGRAGDFHYRVEIR